MTNRNKIIVMGTVILVAVTAAAGYFIHRSKMTGPVTGGGKLEILLATPQGEDVPISTEGVTIMFDRSMVPLTALDAGRDHSIDLKIDPPLEGRFFWLGTQGFIFRPVEPFAPATTYHVTLPADIASLDGSGLEKPIEWAFSTVTPRVIEWAPQKSGWSKASSPLISPKDASIFIIFNIAMNRESVEKNITIIDLADKQPIQNGKKFVWKDNDHILQLQFTDNLPWNTSLEVAVGAGVLGKNGNLGSKEPVKNIFQTPGKEVVIEKVYKAYPDETISANKEFKAEVNRTLCYKFSQPIVSKSFEKAFHSEVTGLEKKITPYFSYQDYDSFSTVDLDMNTKYITGYKSACASFLDEPNRQYKFFIDPKEIISIYGGEVTTPGEKYSVRTLHFSPKVRTPLQKNLISLKGSLKIPYEAVNTKTITVRIYPYSNEKYTENVKSALITGLKEHYDPITKVSQAVYPPEGKLSVWPDFTVPVDIASMTIDQKRLPSLAAKEFPLVAVEDVREKFSVDLSEVFPNGLVKPGVYLIEVTGATKKEGSSSRLDAVYTMVQITPIALAIKREVDHILIWATDIETGVPKAGLPVQVTYKKNDYEDYDDGSSDEGSSGKAGSVEAVTNDQGVAILKSPWGKKGHICAAAMGEENSSYSCETMHGITDYRSLLASGKDYFTYVYTDRPIYRPGQTVFFSSFIREAKEGRYFMLKPGSTAEVRITDSTEVNIFEDKKAKVESGGVVSGSVKLSESEDVPRGEYRVSIKVGKQTFSRKFFVASYRKPSFKVDIKTDKNEIASRQELKASVLGTYFFGAPMRKAKASWSIMTSTYIFQPEGYGEYNFIDDDILYRKGIYGSSNEEDDPEYYSSFEYDVVDSSEKHAEDQQDQVDDPRGNAATRSSGSFLKKPEKRALDNAGLLDISYKPDLSKYPTSQRLTLETNVTDPSDQQVSAAEDVIVHKADFYLGIKPESWIYGEKQLAMIDLVSLDTKGKTSGSKAFSVEVVSREYEFIERRNSSGYWDFSFEPKDTKLTTLSGKTDKSGSGRVQFTIPKGGTYRFIAKGNDSNGNAIQSAVDVYAWGKGYVPWRLDKPQELELVPDKSSYKIGDTARILIKSLVPATQALMTLERGRVLEYKMIELGGNASHVEIPITAGFVPNIYVSIIAHTGRTGEHSPLLFKGETELKIEPDSKRLNIAIKTDHKGEDGKPAIYRPGDEVSVSLEAKDNAGKPVKAHIIVSVADESVLRLLNYELPDLVKKFYFLRPNSVTTSSSLISLKAGDSGPSSAKKRRIFKDTAHFEAHLKTNDQGMADLKFKLPDDLTTWVIEAVAISESKTVAEFENERKTDEAQVPEGQKVLGTNLALDDNTFVGSGRSSVMTTLPLLLRPAMPRFAAWGDEVAGKIIANNQNPRPVNGSIILTITGDGVFKDGKLSQELPLKVQANSEIAYPVELKVVGYEAGAITVSARAVDEKGRVLDDLETSFPTLDRFSPEVTATSGMIKTAEKEQLDVPTAVSRDKGGLDISLKGSMGLAVACPMKNLIYFPWGCSEQKSATLLALLMARDMSAKFGEKYFDMLSPVPAKEINQALGDSADLESKLKLLDDKIKNIIEDLIVKFQMLDGGMRYWPESKEADLYHSAQVFWAFSMARDLKFNVNEEAYRSLKDYILFHIDRSPNLQQDDMEAYALWTLSLGEGWRDDISSELLANLTGLSNSGLAYLAMALKNHYDAGNAEKVADRIRVLARQEPRHVSWNSSNFFWSSAVKNTALSTLALLINNPNDPIIPKAMAFLFNRKNVKRNDLTQDDLYLSSLAYNYSKVMNEETTDLSSSVSIGGRILAERSFDLENILELFTTNIPMAEISSIPMPADINISKNGEGTLYYDLLLKYYLPPDMQPTREEGVMISREYYNLDDLDEAKALTEFTVGETYKAHMIVTVPNGLNYALVQDLLPAGFEPVDTMLATTSRAEELKASEDGEEGSQPSSKGGLSQYDDEIKIQDFGADFGFQHQEVRDDSIVWSDKIVPAGIYHLRYPVRATTAGKYIMSGATVFEFYEPEIFGRSRGRIIEIKDRD